MIHPLYCFCSVTCKSEGMRVSMLWTEYVVMFYSCSANFHKITLKYIWTIQMNLLLVVENLVCMRMSNTKSYKS